MDGWMDKRSIIDLLNNSIRIEIFSGMMTSRGSLTRKTRVFLRHRKPRVHWFIAHYLLLLCWELGKIAIANFARHAWMDWVWVHSGS